MKKYKAGYLFNNQKLEDGIYEVGFYSPDFETDEVLYATAKIKKEVLVYVDYVYQNEKTKLYPQDKNAFVEYGVYRGMLIYNKFFRPFSAKGHSTLIFFLNKL